MELLVCLPNLERFLLCDGFSLKPPYIVQTERHCGSSMAGREGGWKFCGAEKEPHVQQLGKNG
jgi:hypothetical protein